MDVRARTRRWRIRGNLTACILDGLDLFSECTVKQLRLVAQFTCPISVTPDRVIVQAGDSCNQLVLVVSGEGEASSPHGGAKRLGPGSLFGEQSLLPGSVEIATVTATTPMDLLVSSRAELVRMIRVAPSIESKLLARVARQSPAVRPEVVEVERPRHARVAFTA